MIIIAYVTMACALVGPCFLALMVFSESANVRLAFGILMTVCAFMMGAGFGHYFLEPMILSFLSMILPMGEGLGGA